MIWLSIYGSIMGKGKIRAACVNQSIIASIISYHVSLTTFSYEYRLYIYASLSDSCELFNISCVLSCKHQNGYKDQIIY